MKRRSLRAMERRLGKLKPDDAGDSCRACGMSRRRLQWLHRAPDGSLLDQAGQVWVRGQSPCAFCPFRSDVSFIILPSGAKIDEERGKR